ncbi:hypothetical protein IGI04_031948 [Brassica rapa subsp. trilocularis]|uniref:BHLH domain-containing protein n=1 Tax=Brassica rapa subsp. trilocularis TaxID=1813537 RepID=A0ABQ7LV21_BRACM|nr:hypothetical protein IGI04_031948 [Brassica rapa subsp. trilocularis]
MLIPTGKKRKDQLEDDFTSGYGSWLQLANRKAVMLDEIIEYVQSLQRQVEFLLMKLATINPRVEFNPITALSTEVIQPGGSLTQSLYATAFSE